jgi:hypothetical protein
VSIEFAEKSIETGSFDSFLKGPAPFYLPVSGRPLNDLERVRSAIAAIDKAIRL